MAVVEVGPLATTHRPGLATSGVIPTHSCGGTDRLLRRVHCVNLDDLLLDARDDSLDVLAEPAVVLLLALPDLRR